MRVMQRFWRQWQRRWRLSEMRLLFLALLVAATVMSAVGFFTDRVERHMLQQATNLMGGDLILQSARSLDEVYFQQADTLSLQHSRLTKFASMVSNSEDFQLSQVKAVSNNYPLKGDMYVTRAGNEQRRLMTQGPAVGKIWLDRVIINALQLKLGDHVQLGTQSFELEYILLQEPDRGTSFLQLAPVALINHMDLDKTGLLSEGSRARHIAYFMGEDAAVQRFVDWVTPRLQPTEKVRTLNDGLPSVQQALQRATRFLGLAALLSVILAGTAIALTSSSLVKRETRAVAVLKALGWQRQSVILEQVLPLLGLAILAALLGAAVGYFLQFLLSNYLANMIGETLPAAGLAPMGMAVMTSLMLLLGFALPYIWQLSNTAPIQILKSTMSFERVSMLWMAACLLPALYLLFWLQAQDMVLALWLLLATLAGVVLFWVLAQLLLGVINRLSLQVDWAWLSVFRSARRSLLLLIVFAVGFFSLLLLTTVRTDLLNRWEATLPPDAPNHFLINIQPQEQKAVADFLKDNDLPSTFYPMIRGRLVAINDQPVSEDDYKNERARRLLNREFNLSSYPELASSNKVLQGEWFKPGEHEGFSLEQGIGETLGIAYGDQLTFDIAGVRYTQAVTSVREVRWDSMQPNFFVVAAPGQLDDKPHTFITSVHIPDDKTDKLSELLGRFPSVTDLDTSQVLKQVRELIDRATFAVQGIFLFTLIAGVVVLIAALQSQRAERQQEVAIFKSLGANSKALQQRILVEFIALGALAGLFGGFLASLVGWLLAAYLFDLYSAFSVWPLGLGMLLGGLLVGSVGFLNLRGLLVIPPMLLLKDS